MGAKDIARRKSVKGQRKILDAKKIRALRQERGVTLYDLAERVGRTPGHLANLESGRYRSGNYDVAERLGEFFGVDPEDLMIEGTGDEAVKKETLEGPYLDAGLLCQLRAEKGVSQVEAARALGINPTTLSLLETGRRRKTSVEILDSMAEYYGVSRDDLITDRRVTDLTTLIWSSEAVMIEGEVIDVQDEEVTKQLLLVLRIGAAWIQRNLQLTEPPHG